MPNLLIGITGSVASIKLSFLIEALLEKAPELCIRVVVTESSKHFINEALQISQQDSLEIITKSNQRIRVFDDSCEWKAWNKIGDHVLHIELRKWADIFLIAPLDANSLGKISNGLCDNLLTCIIRAWDCTDPLKRVIVAPAMNTMMWDHPLTSKHLKCLKEDLKYLVIPPIAKTLACGDSGIGAMASVEDIAQYVIIVFKDLALL
ncbi:hypothetical protein DSO57_1006269 [Entomophthora muscae]|uniref:Uncharacterized protein n=1 Tax=Entomophthora muscae TaxID=34485 RepID=A0ACC2TVA4_9FUNG|nr:hypothetical protein DSO57_1006269 [Entomophthora muscae]